MKLSGKWTKKKWVSYTIATCSAVLLYMILSNLSCITDGLGAVYKFLKPVVIGLIIAYIFNPVSKVMNDHVFKKIKKEGARWKLSVAFTLIVILLAVVLLCVALIPQLIDSVATFASNLGGYIDALQDTLRGLENTSISNLFGFDLQTLASATDTLLDRIGEYLTNNIGNFATATTNLGKGLLDVALGFILAIYLLLDKTRLMEGIKKLAGLIMKPDKFSSTGEFIGRCNDIIIRYISFDIIDGIIVGIINFVFMLIAGMPYAVLVSVIAGITNLAPTFGPIIGAVIGGFVLVLVNPWYGLAFIIFTIILQTIDGYILKPKLFGESLGVSPLMILISIILGGRLFGVAGILLAIPFAAILDFVYRDFVLKILEETHNKRYNKE